MHVPHEQGVFFMYHAPELVGEEIGYVVNYNQGEDAALQILDRPYLFGCVGYAGYCNPVKNVRNRITDVPNVQDALGSEFTCGIHVQNAPPVDDRAGCQLKQQLRLAGAVFSKDVCDYAAWNSSGQKPVNFLESGGNQFNYQSAGRKFKEF